MRTIIDPVAPIEPTDIEAELTDAVAEYYANPLGFVMFAYPWGEPGTGLEHAEGPDTWQREFLIELGEQVRQRRFNGVDPVAPIRMAVASGHGIGKSALSAWLTDWIMSTRPGAVGTVTANTFPQLQTKTWARIQEWTARCITAGWFEISGSRMKAKEAPESWHCAPQTCREENSEGFAGQHAATSTSFYIFDEASAVPDAIWEVAEGGLTDGEPMVFVFGNPTRQRGRFYKAVFGSDQHLWSHRSIDSRTSKLTNKAIIQEWIDHYGEDSDFCRVRILGLPPTASELQYIDSERVLAAQKREVETLQDEPLVAGFDASGGGEAWNVCRFRCGLDARSIPAVKMTGQKGRDRSLLVAMLAEVLDGWHIFPDGRRRKVAALFADAAFGSPIVERLRSMGHRNVHEVSFGSASPDNHDANYRAYMWRGMKEWLPRGAIDSDQKLEIGLTAPGYHLNRKDQLTLESKQDMVKRGEASPDDGDALALTFAQKVAPGPKAELAEEIYSSPGEGWMAG